MFARGVATSIRSGMQAAFTSVPSTPGVSVAPVPPSYGQTVNHTNTSTVNNHFNQTVNSNASGDQTISNFGLLAAMANGTVRGV
jgi:hypothetical protein